MKYLMSRSLNILFLALSFAALISLTGAVRVESIGTVKQEDAATAIANVCTALLEACGRQPEICAFAPPDNTLLIDLYNDAVGDILALDLESNPNDIALAKGIINAALISAVARQPIEKIRLEQVKSICDGDIDAL